MPKFKYKGVGADGKTVKGEITASGRGDAINTLRQGRIRVTSIKELGKSILDIQIGEEKVKISDLSRVTRQFSSMTSAGLPLVQCMDILSEQTENRTLSKALHSVSVDIQSGNSLADSLRKHKKIFNPLYCNMVEAGEASGNLDGVLERLSTYLEKSDQLQRKIKGALMYPAILLLIAVGVTIIMLTFVIPKFAKMFTDFGGTLPLPTRITMSISDFLQAYFIYIIIAIIGIVIGIKKYYSTEKGAYVIDSFLLKLPVLGDLLRKGAVSRFSQTLATLLGSGVSILQALKITAKTSGNKVIEKGLLGSVESISGGKTISDPLKTTGIFPPMVIHMIAVGEKTGDITGMLQKVAQFYEEEVDAAVDALTAVLEPIMIVVLGVVVGGLLVSMYLPMFDIMNQVG